MILITLILVTSAHAVIVNSGDCLVASTAAKQCCDNPLADACVTADTRALNDKLKAYQESLGRRTAGLHDIAEENRAKAEAMRQSAQLNLRSAEHCEQLSNECATKCGNLTTSDAKSALGRCQATAKIVDNLREQAARDEASAKRTARGTK